MKHSRKERKTVRSNPTLHVKQLLRHYASADRTVRFELFREHELLREAFLEIEAKDIARAMREARGRRDIATPRTPSRSRHRSTAT